MVGWWLGVMWLADYVSGWWRGGLGGWLAMSVVGWYLVLVGRHIDCLLCCVQSLTKLSVQVSQNSFDFTDGVLNRTLDMDMYTCLSKSRSD